MFFLFALAACLDAAPLPARPPPPPVVNISSTPLVDGWPATFDVELVGVGRGVQVHLIGSWASTYQSSCPAWFNGGCINLMDPFLIGTGRTDTTGHAHIRWTAETSTASSLRVQALVFAQTFASTATALTYQEVDDDADDDGIDADEEMRLGIDPMNIDTDGGGTTDNQEIYIDQTDPRRLQDDLPGDRSCNSIDGDSDGLQECDDPDCRSVAACFELTCQDRRDNDRDGLTDCEDPHCSWEPRCAEQACTDGRDNDGDGLRDCRDDDCWTPDCLDEVVAWVDAGSLTYRIVGAGVSLDHNLEGRVWVSGATGAGLCVWYSRQQESADDIDVLVDPACPLSRAFLPTISSLVIDAAAGLRAPNGALFAGPLVDYQPGDTTVRIEHATSSEPFGACAGGITPTLMWLDHDGDGYGVDSPTDLFGAPGGRVWVCDPNHPGLTLTPGDCHDGDPDHNPVQVALPPGVTCADLRFDDQDGDGAPRGTDSDDHNPQAR